MERVCSTESTSELTLLGCAAQGMYRDVLYCRRHVITCFSPHLVLMFASPFRSSFSIPARNSPTPAHAQPVHQRLPGTKNTKSY